MRGLGGNPGRGRRAREQQEHACAHPTTHPNEHAPTHAHHEPLPGVCGRELGGHLHARAAAHAHVSGARGVSTARACLGGARAAPPPRCFPAHARKHAHTPIHRYPPPVERAEERVDDTVDVVQRQRVQDAIVCTPLPRRAQRAHLRRHAGVRVQGAWRAGVGRVEGRGSRYEARPTPPPPNATTSPPDCTPPPPHTHTPPHP